VFFRRTIYNHAKKLDVRGFVQNLDNGDVLLIAESDKDRLEKLLQHIQSDPGKACIQDIKWEYLPMTGQYSDFSIKINYR